MRSGVLTGNDTRWRSASSGSPLDPAVCSYNRPTYAGPHHSNDAI